jgi:hypothetical protein
MQFSTTLPSFKVKEKYCQGLIEADLSGAIAVEGIVKVGRCVGAA